MALNIKNADTEALAREIARRTGESLTEALTVSLRERLLRLTAEERIAERTRRLSALSHDASGRWRDDLRTADHGTLLYDEQGLPR